MVSFTDRAAGGRALAPLLEGHRGSNAVVLGVPRGGVVTAAAVARELHLPLDAVVVRKLGAAGHEEFAVGAIAEGVRMVVDQAVRSAGMTDAELAAAEAAERAELTRRMASFPARFADLTGRAAIIVDDGIATGSSAIAACRAVRDRAPERVVLAVPVAPAGWVPPVDVADEFVVAHAVRDFWAVGQHYDDFTQTTDAEVIALLRG